MRIDCTEERTFAACSTSLNETWSERRKKGRREPTKSCAIKMPPLRIRVWPKKQTVYAEPHRCSHPFRRNAMRISGQPRMHDAKTEETKKEILQRKVLHLIKVCRLALGQNGKKRKTHECIVPSDSWNLSVERNVGSMCCLSPAAGMLSHRYSATICLSHIGNYSVLGFAT